MSRPFAPLRPPVSQPARVIRPRIEPGRRVVAVSDIHGNLPFLKGLLDAVRFSPADVLILVGDLLEKGRDSLATLRYVMELGRTHTVYPLCGNCDHIDQTFLSGPGMDEALWPVLSQFWRERSVLLQMGAELGLAPRRQSDLPALRAALLEHFPRETGFLLSLPTILEAGNFLFVHGGVPREDDLEGLDAYECMKNDDFRGQGRSFRKWVVVGHWPVTLYREDIPSSAPIIDRERKIISIDGACVLKVDGQLNALMLPSEESEDFAWTAWDGLPEARALDGQPASEHSLNIRWGRSALELLEEGEELSLCRHLETGRQIYILNAYLRRDPEKGLWCEDSTDYCLPVEAGEVLTVVRRTKTGALCKKNGVTGWYFGRLSENLM